jgi:hypothetical protein
MGVRLTSIPLIHTLTRGARSKSLHLASTRIATPSHLTPPEPWMCVCKVSAVSGTCTNTATRNR